MIRIDDAARVDPPCAHAADCGGCALQAVALADLAAAKARAIEAALARRGIETEIAAPITVAPRSRRRARFAALRAKKAVRLGFFKARSHEVVDTPHCLLVRPALAAAREALAALAGVAAPRSKPIGLWATETEGGLDIAVEKGKALDLALRGRAAAWAEAWDVARLSWSGETIARRRAAVIPMGRALVEPPPGGFLQATAEGEAAMTALAAEALAGAGRVADLFAGVGPFALRLAEQAEVLAVEGEAAAVAALETAWRGADGLKRVRAVCRDLFRRPLRTEELKGLDAVVFDPPRQGAEAQAQALARFGGDRIVGVSCDADTFARDAAILIGGGWRLTRVTPIDQFLWSPHIELVGVFRR